MAERIINEKFKVEVHGRLIHWSKEELEAKQNEKYHCGTITSVLENGEYRVRFDDLAHPSFPSIKKFRQFPASDMRFV